MAPHNSEASNQNVELGATNLSLLTQKQIKTTTHFFRQSVKQLKTVSVAFHCRSLGRSGVGVVPGLSNILTNSKTVGTRE